MSTIDLNSDLGENVPDRTVGDDEAMLGVVTSANVSCGFHAGSPEGIRATLEAAVANGVTIGAHPGYRDYEGFGRLAMDVDSATLQAHVEYQLGALQALAGAGDGIDGEGRDIIRARFGFNVYVGSGRCEPGPARLPDPLGPVLRTGFAVEAARLLGADASVEAILDVYRGERPSPTGAAVSGTERLGRYSLPLVAPGEHGTPHVPVFGGGLRPVGATPDEDATIAALEAMFWLESTPAEVFLPWVDDPRPRVRRTAARLVGRAPPTALDLAATLQRLSTEHSDPTVQWHASQALSKRAWEAPALRSGGGD